MLESDTVVAFVSDTDRAPGVVDAAHALVDPKRGGRVVVGSALRPLPPAAHDLLVPYAGLGDDYDAIRAELAELATSRLQKRVSGADVHVAWGEPADALGAIVERVGPSMVVVDRAADGAARPGEVADGTAAVLRRSSVPVLVSGTAAGDGQGTMLLATDLAPATMVALQWLLPFAVRGERRIVPLHVVPDVSAWDHAGVIGRSKRDGVGGRVAKEAKRLFAQIRDGLTLDFPVDVQLDDRLGDLELESGDPGATIVSKADALGVDLIVLMRSRALTDSGQRFGRVAEYVVRHTALPVLVLPPPTPEVE